ncbi:hypothetical protein BFW01_g853 [Lasiodiplodia theobromae]|uniref:Uncharacterized protein n=1 Tax=Lasiodiplodia theobromae TaxID=45133 RepID=A0A8H7MCB7_9PEZI|nr:tRNA pseudouridine synthase D [Lasiodiplodia theobromae]KAF4546150.1 tRNA pseudouridine synthase D [Lasiodiplodia theobromae]KAF9630291.1 hypothetical protein BFW01_g853 [Lasiodiplodia theobromae]
MLPEDPVQSMELESNELASHPIDSDQKPNQRDGRKRGQHILTNEEIAHPQMTQSPEKLAQTGTNSHEDPLGQTCDIPSPAAQVQQGLDCTLEDAISNWDDLASGFWASDPAEASYWFLNPYFSQLDTLPLNMDGMNVVS